MKNTLTFAFILLAASFVNAQNCIVVSQHKNRYIDSTGSIGKLHTHYSDRQLSKLASKGIHVVSIPDRKSFVSARDVCGLQALIQLEEREMPKVIASLPVTRRCVEVLIDAKGNDACERWVTLPSEVQH